jgi:hypothetical protein
VDDGPVDDILMKSLDLDGLQMINCIKFWRYLSADEAFDVKYRVTRIEMDPENRATPVPVAA